ncbi:hypothetical protein RB213_005072, partial [Colletotrichum asianum]
QFGRANRCSFTNLQTGVVLFLFVPKPPPRRRSWLNCDSSRPPGGGRGSKRPAAAARELEQSLKSHLGVTLCSSRWIRVQRVHNLREVS